MRVTVDPVERVRAVLAVLDAAPMESTEIEIEQHCRRIEHGVVAHESTRTPVQQALALPGPLVGRSARRAQGQRPEKPERNMSGAGPRRGSSRAGGYAGNRTRAFRVHSDGGDN